MTTFKARQAAQLFCLRTCCPHLKTSPHPQSCCLRAVQVNSLKSFDTEMPYEYYGMPFCKPPEGIKRAKNMANPGTLIEGLRIENSPYNFSIRVGSICDRIQGGQLGFLHHRLWAYEERDRSCACMPPTGHVTMCKGVGSLTCMQAQCMCVHAWAHAPLWTLFTLPTPSAGPSNAQVKQTSQLACKPSGSYPPLSSSESAVGVRVCCMLACPSCLSC